MATSRTHMRIEYPSDATFDFVYHDDDDEARCEVVRIKDDCLAKGGKLVAMWTTA